MPGIGNNLYPPIIATYMPAFVRTTACKVYFSLSSYNTDKEIQNVQVIVNNQNTNMSVLAEKLYPAGIKIANLQIDDSISSDDKYFITINPEDLQSGVFELNQYYKIQIRFTGTGAAPLTDNSKIASWLVNNQSFFSEWSTVCLIKGIQKPDIYLKGFENIDTERDVIFSSEVIDFIGSMYYSENSEIEKEYMKSYNIKIYKNDGSLIYNSGDINTNIYNPNEINYTLKTALEDGISYKVVLTYTTINGYTSNINYSFIIIQNTIEALNARIYATPEEDFGRIKIDIIATISEIFFGNITIRRTSNESNFTVWEDIHETTIKDRKPLNYTWYDYTVESGVWYKYCVQKRNSRGDRGSIINIRYPVMIVLDDMFLTRDGMQIKLKYNPSISSFKKTLLESKTETLGSKYPIIRRNGNVGYRQFPISGLITTFCDEEGVFLNKENIYGEMGTYYDSYNRDNDIDKYQDYIYERKFREKVMDFLYDNTIKLFRSTTEGNILVKIMDINFTPNQTLGRMIYSFNATAYEIDDCSLSNFNKYGIQSIGEFSPLLGYSYYDMGQIQGTYKEARQDILKVLQEKYTNQNTEKYINKIKYLKWIRIEFSMPPYLIRTTASGSVVPLSIEEEADEDTVLGYIIYINGKSIIISPRGYYELIDEDTEITSVYFPIESTVSIDYEAKIDQIENTDLLYNKVYFYTKVGQIRDIFNPNENIFLKLYQKYSLNYPSYYQRLLSLNKVSIESDPGVVVYIRDSFDETYFKHEIGDTGVLEFYDEEAVITGIYFEGIQLYKSDPNEDRYELRDNEFKEIKKVDSLNEIINPVKNGVYIVNDLRYIYYRQQWFEFSQENIVIYPVYASIDYIYEIMKGEY